jgi:hypothetical protein
MREFKNPSYTKYSKYTHLKDTWKPRDPAVQKYNVKAFNKTNYTPYSQYTHLEDTWEPKKPVDSLDIKPQFKNPSYTEYSKYTHLKDMWKPKDPANKKKYTNVVDYKKCQPYTYTNFTSPDKPYSACPCNKEKMAPVTKAYRRQKLLPKSN